MQQVDEHLWRFPQNQKLMPGFHLENAMTAVRLEDGSLWLHSPTPIDDARASELDELGPVRHLVAPNRFHHMYAASAMRRYPEAALWGPASLPEKNKKLGALQPLETVEPPWANEITTFALAGIPKVQEFAFFHKASGTLILTDLVFHIHKPKGWIAKLYLRWSDSIGKPSQSKSWKFLISDRPAAKAVFEEILELDIQRALVCHGAPIEGDVKQQLRDGMRWMLQP